MKSRGEKATDRSRWRNALPLLVVLAGVLAYTNSFDGVLLFDDEHHIVNNEQLKQSTLWWNYIVESRRPVVSASLVLNYALGRLDVWGYHAFNLTVHLLAGLTLFGVVRRTLLLQPGLVGTASGARWFALSVALIWVVHPLQTQSVTYIIQRGESMMGLFYLLTLYCAIRGIDSRRGGFWQGASVLACALGMGSKAVMVTAPLIVLLYDRVFVSPSIGRALRRRWGLYVGLAGTWAVLAACGVLGGVLDPAERSRATAGLAFKGISPLEYALTQPGVILHYLKQSVWPHPLCLDYAWPVARSAGAVMVPSLVLAALLGTTVLLLRRKGALGFLGVWFFAIIAPTSSVIPIKDVAFEHRMYLSLASVVILSVGVGHAGLGWLFARFAFPTGLRRFATASSVGAVVLALLVMTTVRNRDYHSAEAMWRTVTAIRPNNARAHSNLGALLTKRNEMEEGIEELHEALRIDPDRSRAHFHLGKALVKLGKPTEAIRSYRAGIASDATYAIAHCNLGNALSTVGRSEEAIASYRRALAIEPSHVLSHYNLGNALLETGRLEESIAAFDRVVQIDPSQGDAHSNRANALMRLGRVADAIDAYQRAIAIDPNHTVARFNLGNALARAGRMDDAVEAYRAVLRLDATHASAATNLGSALAELGRYEEAADAYAIALRANPRHLSAHLNLGSALLESGDPTAAVEAFRAALAIDPDNAAARRGLTSATAAAREK